MYPIFDKAKQKIGIVRFYKALGQDKGEEQREGFNRAELDRCSEFSQRITPLVEMLIDQDGAKGEKDMDCEDGEDHLFTSPSARKRDQKSKIVILNAICKKALELGSTDEMDKIKNFTERLTEIMFKLPKGKVSLVYNRHHIKAVERAVAKNDSETKDELVKKNLVIMDPEGDRIVGTLKFDVESIDINKEVKKLSKRVSTPIYECYM